MIKTLTAAAFTITMACTGASAATFDFAADADAFWGASVANSNPYEGTFDQVYGISSIDLEARADEAGTNGGNSVDGITVTASAGLADPFMDSNLAGLGVCSSGFQVLSGVSECSSGGGSNPGDDNLVTPEILTLSFTQTVSLDGLQIRDANHDLISNTIGAISINGDLYNTGDFGQVLLSALGVGAAFSFTSNGILPGDELYLSVLNVSAVPVPAALPLFLSGLGLMGWVARRRKKATA